MSSSLIPEVMNWAKPPSPSGTPMRGVLRVDQLARGVREALQHRLDRRLGGDRQHRVVHRAQGRALLLHLAIEDTPGQAALRSASSSPTVRSQLYCGRVARPGGAQRVVVEGGLDLVGDVVVVEGVCVARGVAAGLGQGPARAATTGTPHAIASMHVSPKPSCQDAQHEGARARVEARQVRVGDVAEGVDGGGRRSVVAELRAIAAGGDEIDALVAPAAGASSPGQPGSCAPCGSPP